MKRYVIINTESELHEVWTDPALPHMSFSFHEDWIDECDQIDDHLYVATYTTYDVEHDTIFNYHDSQTSEWKSVRVVTGQYGLRPVDQGMTHAELVAFLSNRTP